LLLDRIKLSGTSTRWYKDGQKSDEQNYISGRLNGISTKWYESGQKSEEIVYLNDKRQGKCFWWNEDGSLRVSASYIDGDITLFDDGYPDLFDSNE